MEPKNNPNNKLVAALRYQALGLNIIPVKSDKKPHLTSWLEYRERSATVEEINTWWTQWPDANPALMTGKTSGIVAFDIDVKHGRSSKEFNIPITACARSGGGGEHFFFKYPGVYVKSDSAIAGPGIDIRGDGGYILLSPSVNEKGGVYEWIIPLEDGLAEMPNWLKEKVMNSSTQKKWIQGKDGISEGQRNDTAASIAGKILSSTDKELWESLGWEQLQIWNKKNSSPLHEKELRGVWESIKKYHVDDTQKNLKDDSLLNEICNREDVTLFHDGQNDAHIALDISGHREVWPCKSKSMKRLLARNSWEKNKKALGSEAIKNIVTVLEGKACFDGPKIELQNRTAWQNNTLWYDLTNEKWQAIKIIKDGWEVTDNPPIIFKRYSHHKAQVIPSREGDVKLFLNYINVTNSEHRLLLLVYLVSCFIPDFPHVMLIVFGAQGSSKSTLSKLKRLVVDPSLIEVASFPNSQKELIQTLAHHYFLFFDNVSHISEEQSDILCKAITGGGHTKRELYENDEDVIYSFMRCIGMNGINLVATRPDLLERSLLVELERINPAERKTERELYEKFNNDLPDILGGVFDVLVKAIQIHPNVKVDSNPRMADWAVWGCAISEALGYTKSEFLAAYENNIERQAEMLLNENIVATTLFVFMEDKKDWKGTATELLQQLYTKTPIDYFEKQEKYWPKSAASLSRKLNELSTYLKQMGILVTISTSGIERFIHIQKTIEIEEVRKGPLELPLDYDTYDTDDIISTSTAPIPPEEMPF